MGSVNPEDQGWRPFRPPDIPQDVPTSGFTRLARVHLAMTSADAAVAVALAGSLFFSLPNGEARGQVLLYLVLTMAPFSIVAPLIGPLLDKLRGGRRLMVIVSGLGRAVLCLFMIGHIKSLLFFPEAFGILVLQKTYTVTKPALVPSTVSSDEELVEANSKLSILSGIGSALGAGPAALAYKVGGAPWSLGVALTIYLVGMVLGFQLPKEKVAARGPSGSEQVELHTPSILLGASAMGVVRGIVGFLTLFLAFTFHKDGVPIWQLAVVGVSSVAGSLIGAMVAPALRRVAREEGIITGSLVMILASALAALALGRLRGAMVLAVSIGIGAAVAKLAFDSIVQRDAPDANRGRSFARFETRFQILWVLGATVAIAPMPSTVGYLVIFFVAAVTTFSYVIGSMAAKARAAGPASRADAAAVELDARMSAITGGAKRRVRHAAGGWWFSRRRRRRRVDLEPPPPAPPRAVDERTETLEPTHREP